MARTPARFVGSIGLTNVGRFDDQVVGIFPDAVADATTQTLLPDLFDESVDTFFVSQVNLKVSPGLYVDPDTFFAPKVSHGLKPGLYTDADTFFTSKVNLNLKPNLYVDADGFFTPAITQPSGGQNLFPGLYSDADNFFTPVVRGRYTLTPSLYADSDVFFTPIVKGRYNLSPGLYIDLDNFFGSSLGRRLTPTLYTDSDTFFTHVLSQGLSEQELLPFLYASQVNFFASEIEGGEEEPPTDLSFSQGGGKQRKFRKVESSNVDCVLHEGDTLTIRYKDGSVYNYLHCPEKKFERLAKARSPGNFVHTKIKDKHEYRRFF